MQSKFHFEREFYIERTSDAMVRGTKYQTKHTEKKKYNCSFISKISSDVISVILVCPPLTFETVYEKLLISQLLSQTTFLYKSLPGVSKSHISIIHL